MSQFITLAQLPKDGHPLTGHVLCTSKYMPLYIPYIFFFFTFYFSAFKAGRVKMCVLDIEWWKFFMIYMKFHSVDLKSEMNICTCIFIINIYSLHHYFLFLSDLTDVAKAVDCCNSTSSTHLCFKYHIKSKSQDVSPPFCCKSCLYTCRRNQCMEPDYFVCVSFKVMSVIFKHRVSLPDKYQ